jgi:hypothetical protein
MIVPSISNSNPLNTALCAGALLLSVLDAIVTESNSAIANEVSCPDPELSSARCWLKNDGGVVEKYLTPDGSKWGGAQARDSPHITPLECDVQQKSGTEVGSADLAVVRDGRDIQVF